MRSDEGVLDEAALEDLVETMTAALVHKCERGGVADLRDVVRQAVADTALVALGDVDLAHYRPVPNGSCGHLGGPVGGCQFCDPETAARYREAGRVYG